MDEERELPGLANATGSLERVPIRTRESGFTRSAWRLVVTADAGAGVITFVESSGGEDLYRGDGIFLGWSPDDLKLAWDRLSRTPDEPEVAMPQLG